MTAMSHHESCGVCHQSICSCTFALTHPGPDARSRETDRPPPAPTWALMHGRWQDCLDVECDMWCSDAPFSKRTHAGHDKVEGLEGRAALGYNFLTPEQVCETVDFWEPRTRQWFTTITDHVLFPVWEQRLQFHGRYVFAPIPVIDVGMSFRYLGDGPSSWTCWLLVARPRTAKGRKWRTTRGEYMRCPGDEKSKRKGGKPMNTMRAIIRDYSNPGDLVCDPHAGEAMTIRAALAEGRSGVGSEVDDDAFDAGHALLRGGYTPDLFGPASPGWAP